MDAKEAETICTEAVRVLTTSSSVEDLARVAEMFADVADAGYSEGMFGLAMMKLNAAGVERNLEESMTLFRRAAELGNVPAMFALGQIYSNELRDESKAFEWFSRCVECGFPHAYPILGDCYYDGLGTAVNTAKAIELYRKGTEFGDPMSYFRLGCVYSEGIEVPKDIEKADRMFLQAANAGIPEAQFIIATGAYEGRVPGGKQLAAEWFGRCADKIPTACFNLASMYCSGDGVEKDLHRGFEMFKGLADQGDSDAMFQTGKMMMAGEGTVQEPDRGFEYICKAADAGNADAAMVVESVYRRQNRQFVKIDGVE